MQAKPWSDDENDLIVADYFAMLASDVQGRPYSKARHRRALLPLLSNRSAGSVEMKHQNISAVLQVVYSEPWIGGYKPALNFQRTLVEAVGRRLARDPDWLSRAANAVQVSGVREGPALFVGAPPTLSNQPDPPGLEKLLHFARRFDAAGRDERNRALGKMGEERVLEHERMTLTDLGRGDLARRIRWVSDEDGDGAGYDIASFTADGRERLIEVKTTNGWDRTPFYISRNEKAVADARPREWRLVRVYNFYREPRAFELSPPLESHVRLIATNFEATFQ